MHGEFEDEMDAARTGVERSLDEIMDFLFEGIEAFQRRERQRLRQPSIESGSGIRLVWSQD